MSESRGLKVFISWSGGLAKQVAIDLRELLPVVFDGVNPWVSDRDIEAGGRSMHEISRELDETAFGVIVITRENQASQWLNFEAGALSKRFGNDDGARVVPLLVDMEAIAELTGPMTQFQAKLLTRQGLEDVLVALGAALSVSEEVVKRRLNNEWEQFDEKLTAAKSKTRHPSQQPKRGVDSMVEETLELVRVIAQQVDVQTPSGSGLNHSLVERKRRALIDAMDLEPFFRKRGISDWTVTNQGQHLTVSIDDPFLSSQVQNNLYTELTQHLRTREISQGFRLVINGEEEPPF